MERTGIIRSVTTRLRMLMSERRKGLRRGPRYEARLPFIVTPLAEAKLSRKRQTVAPALIGHTRDLSETSMTLLLSSVRIGNTYLTDGESQLEVRLELPDGPVSMLTSSVRFEQLPTKDDGCGYLLAVSIIEVEESVRARYISFLKEIKRMGKRTHERRQAAPNAATTPPNDTAQPGTWDALTPTSISNAFERFLDK